MRLCKRNLNAAHFYACLSLASMLAACSGQQNGSSLIPPANMRTQTGVAHRTKTRAAANAALVGKIVARINGGFTIQVIAGCGTDTGKLHVYKNASTTMSGPSPAVNLYAQVTPASGTCSTSVTASAIAISTTIPTAAPSASPSAPPSPNPATSPSAAPTLAPSSAPSGSPIPAQTTTAVRSTIASLFSGGFLLNPSNGNGYMHVYTNAGTIYNSGAPKVGLYVQVAGNGPLTNFTGTYATFSAAAPVSITVSGTATSATSYGFTLNAGTSTPAVPVVMTAQTVVGGSPLVAGSTVKVTGLGALSSSIIAQQIVVSAPVAAATPTPGPISQKHLLTADYLGSPYGTTTVAWSTAAQYLSWAQVTTANANAVSSAGIKTQYYSDPNTTANDGDPLYSPIEAAFAHDCNGNRISWAYDNVTMYQMQINYASLLTAFTNLITTASSGAHFDAIFEDEAGPLTGYNRPALPCNYSDATWLAYGQALNQLSSVPVIFNGLSSLNGESPSLSIGLLNSSNTIGGNYEHCYSDASPVKETGWLWQAVENTELQVSAKNKIFECQTRNLSAANTETDARLYALASFLLTYNPSTSILWEQYATPSGLHVLPESQLVLLAPKVAAPSSISGLAQTGGAYGREYGQCYYAGQFVGPCAVVVNPDPAAPHAFPFPQYTHTLQISGSGVLDGGTVATNGPAPPLNLAAGEAAIVFP